MELKIITSQHPLPVAVLKVAAALIILPFSLIIYLAGILLTLTIIGAIIGIPLILSTYAIDVLAFSALMNPRGKITRVSCPNCGKGKYIIPYSMDLFSCKKCKKLVKLTFFEDREETGNGNER